MLLAKTQSTALLEHLANAPLGALLESRNFQKEIARAPKNVGNMVHGCTIFPTCCMCIHAPFLRRFMVRFVPYILSKFKQPRGFQRFHPVHACTKHTGAIRPILNGANWRSSRLLPHPPPSQEPKNQNPRAPIPEWEKAHYSPNKTATQDATTERAPNVASPQRFHRRQTCRL